MSDKTEREKRNAAEASAKLAPSLFQIGRQVGVPIFAYESPDPAASMATLTREALAVMNGKGTSAPVMVHDFINGLLPWRDPVSGKLNTAGEDWLSEHAPDGPIQTGNATECLSLLCRVATTKPASMEKALVFMLGASRAMMDGNGFNASLTQAIWNCRDRFKSVGASLVLLGPAFTLPPLPTTTENKPQLELELA